MAAGFTITITGLDVLQQRLSNFASTLPKQAAEAMTAAFQRGSQTAKSQVPVDTGTLKGSISVGGSGTNVKLSATAPYAGYVEFGTRYMSAQPYMQPAYDAILQYLQSSISKSIRI